MCAGGSKSSRLDALLLSGRLSSLTFCSILEWIYLDIDSLRRIACASRALRNGCCPGGKLHDFRLRFGEASTGNGRHLVRVLELDLTTESIADVGSDVPPCVEVLEVVVSRGTAGGAETLIEVLPRLRCLRHIHLRLVPNPGWLVADFASSEGADVVADCIERKEIKNSDSDAFILARLARESEQEKGRRDVHLHKCMDAIYEALADATWSPRLSSVSMFALLSPANLYDFSYRKFDDGPARRGFAKDFSSWVTFMNEDPVSSESEWRRLQCSAGYMLVGRSEILKSIQEEQRLTKPENDTLGMDRRLFDHSSYGGSGHGHFALRSKYEGPFSSHYILFQPFGAVRPMSDSCSVQVPGVFPSFARLVGREFADRFIRPNPQHGDNTPWEVGRVYYDEGAPVDLNEVRSLLEDEISAEDSSFEDTFSDFDEAATVNLAHQVGYIGVPGSEGDGLKKPRFSVPPVNASDDEARLIVEGSVLNGLTPHQPGVAAESWQQLAMVASEQPDIKWLGRQPHGHWTASPKEQYYHDFRVIHAGQHTDLQNEGHRDRFGEKCMKYGGIDLCIRTLDVWPSGVRVGYGGVLDMFKEVSCIMSFNHFLPKISFFLQPQHFSRWIQPALTPGDSTTRQQVANSILARMSTNDVRDAQAAEVIRACREVLKAEPSFHEEQISRKLGYGTVWDNLFGEFVSRGREALQSFDLMLRCGLPLSESGRGDAEEAETLIEEWDRASGFGDFNAFVARCESMCAFDSEGMEVLKAHC